MRTGQEIFGNAGKKAEQKDIESIYYD